MFQLKKQRAVESSFVSLFDENGVEFLIKSRLSVQIDFDLDLEIQAELLDVLPFSLLQDDSKLCAGLITQDVLTQEMKILPACRTALCSEGLPIKFYSAFWDLLGPGLLSVLNGCFSRGFLPLSQREDLFHKNDDPQDLKNWRLNFAS